MFGDLFIMLVQEMTIVACSVSGLILANASTSSSQESLSLGAVGWGSGGAVGGGASPSLPRTTASAVSIATMHQQKKRGIKSSLGRFFSKKDKAGMPVSNFKRKRVYT